MKAIAVHPGKAGSIPGSSIYGTIGLQDFTTDNVYYERGINLLHGYLTEYYVEDASYVFPLPETLREVGVLLEPLTVAEKGVNHAFEIQRRLKIWEPRHFVYSKVMAWVALDRLVRLAELDGREGDLDSWRATREEIRELVEREGVDGSVFTQSFGDGGKLDASNLMIPIVGFVPHGDPRARATVDRIADELSANGFVYRYITDGVDGLAGDEATFAICSFWLVECLARAGEPERARELYERLLSFCNDVGLLAEEIDPHSSEMLGNFPQAFSHLGIIQAAIALDMPEASMTMVESGTAVRG